jgi:hypothetical protein
LRLAAHNSWNYNGPGTTGIAESKPEVVEEPSLDLQIKDVLKEYNNDADPRKELQELHEALLAVCKKEAERNVLASYFIKRHDQMYEFLTATVRKDSELILNFLGIALFCDTVNVTWLPIGPE